MFLRRTLYNFFSTIVKIFVLHTLGTSTNALCDHKTNGFDNKTFKNTSVLNSQSIMLTDNKFTDCDTDVNVELVQDQIPVPVDNSFNYGYNDFSNIKKPDDLTQMTIKHLEQTDHEQLVILVKNNWLLLKVIENQTEELCKIAIINDPPKSTFYMSSPWYSNYGSYDDYFYYVRTMVRENHRALDYVKNQTEEICKFSVQHDWRSLNSVRNQTEDICKCALDKDVSALRFVKNQTVELCKYALDKDISALEWIKDQTEDIYKYALDKDVRALKWIENQTMELCKYALDKDVHALKWINDQNEELCKYALDKDVHALKWINHQSVEICEYALDKDLNAWQFIKFPTIEIIYYYQIVLGKTIRDFID